MLTTPRSFSLVILLALLVSLILVSVAVPLVANRPRPQISLCSDPDVALIIECR